MRRLGSLFVTPLAALAVALGVLALPAPAAAAPPGLTVAPVGPAYAGTVVRVIATVADAAGVPLSGEPVTFSRRGTVVATVSTGTDGLARLDVAVAKDPAQNTIVASHGGASVSVALPLLRRGAVLTVGGPRAVIDERSTSVTVTWRADNGEPVSGPVTLLVSSRGGPWRRAAVLRTGQDGRAVHVTTPRHDTRWRVQAGALPWVAGGSSAVHRIDNRPPGRAVRIPKKAPKPRKVRGERPRAVGAGANPVITPLPAKVWRSMVGRSWHRGCPVGRSGLRLIAVNYWDYTGYRRRGELVVADEVAGQIAAAVAELHQRRIPIRTMVRVDRFGWSKRLRGGDDYKSMAAGNTSAFNCRDVVGRPGVRSPHSWGRSLDINPWENPYRSRHGLVPNRWWHSHPHPRVSWRSRGHIVVRVMAKHGLRWTYGTSDSHHFDAVPRGASRPLLPRACADLAAGVCH